MFVGKPNRERERERESAEWMTEKKVETPPPVPAKEVRFHGRFMEVRYGRGFVWPSGIGSWQWN